MGQYIQVGNDIPAGVIPRGDGMAEVEAGRGQYIQAGNDIPSGTIPRFCGWVEVQN
jgi:hypothetical protein